MPIMKIRVEDVAVGDLILGHNNEPLEPRYGLRVVDSRPVQSDRYLACVILEDGSRWYTERGMVCFIWKEYRDTSAHPA